MTILDRRATQETLGLTQMFHGNIALAEAMGASSGKEIIEAPEPSMFSICQNCFLSEEINLAECWDKAQVLERLAE